MNAQLLVHTQIFNPIPRAGAAAARTGIGLGGLDLLILFLLVLGLPHLVPQQSYRCLELILLLGGKCLADGRVGPMVVFEVGIGELDEWRC